MDFSKEAIEAAENIKKFIETAEDIYGTSKLIGMPIPKEITLVIDFARNKSSLSHDECIEKLKELFPNDSSETYEAYYVSFNKNKYEPLPLINYNPFTDCRF